MKNSEILADLNLGSSVAENDENLRSYFVPTVALADFLKDRYDLILGGKGSGKSALLRVVVSEKQTYKQLQDIMLHVATEHTGEPSFKRGFGALRKGEYSEPDLVNAWKTYLLNLALDALESTPDTPERRKAIEFSEQIGIRYRTESAYKKVLWSLLRIFHPTSFTIGADSIKADFPDVPPEIWTKKDTVIDFPEALRLCVRAFEKVEVRCWILIDRLDAAFQSDPELERLALKSLLTAYKDFMGQVSLRFKLFFRTDLFDQVISGTGFRELTHVMDRTSPPMSWDGDKLLVMILERFLFNQSIQQKYGMVKDDLRNEELRQLLFFSIFPNQVDVGEKKSDSWTWMLNRIRDGNNIRTPRDLHSLIVNAARKQQDALSIGGDEKSGELILAPAIKAGLSVMSLDKVRTTLIAENPNLETAIRAFSKKKAEHNATTLEGLLGSSWVPITVELERIGLLEKVGEAWKIPLLYRDGLEISQGAAFEK